MPCFCRDICIDCFSFAGQQAPERISEVVSSALESEIVQAIPTPPSAEAPDDNALSYISYRVKQGDMIGYIAAAYNVTQDTIISVNNIKNSRSLQIGQYLKIPSMPGILYTVKNDGETSDSIAKKYDVDAEKISFVNNLQSDSSLVAGATIFVPDAELDWVTRQEINGDLFINPLPNVRYWISSPYGWRSNPFNATKRTFHGGMDMACAAGNKVHPALAGTVTTAGWSDVYGNYVIISHHSGYQTLYGHMSKLYVTKGQSVNTNTIIGLVGSTGMSTGPHLHFTVYKNGRSMNPATLLK